MHKLVDWNFHDLDRGRQPRERNRLFLCFFFFIYININGIADPQIN